MKFITEVCLQDEEMLNIRWADVGHFQCHAFVVVYLDDILLHGPVLT